MKQYLALPKTYLFSIAILFITYNDWLIGFITNPNLSAVYSTVSELSATGQPYSWLHQLFSIVSGIIILGMVPVVYRFVKSRHNKGAWLLVTSYAVIGVGVIIDGFLPIHCAPSVVAGCQLNDNSILNTLHLLESFITGVFTFIAPLAWWWYHKAERSLLSITSLYFVLMQIAIGAVVIIQKLLGNSAFGIPQRLYLLSSSIWVIVIVNTAYLSWASQNKQ